MKILFLDIDGVMNSDDYYVAYHDTKAALSDIDDAAIDLVLNVIHTTNCRIVLSSSWRCFSLRETLLNMDTYPRWGNFKEKLAKYLVGVTDRLGGTRGEQIDRFISNVNSQDVRFKAQYHIIDEQIESYAILDDSSDFSKKQKERMVCVNEFHGVTESDCNKLIQILNT